jgi:hypothetical protein
VTSCTLFAHHYWRKLGLDVRSGKLVRVRRCSCGAEKTIAYKRGF